MFNVHPDPWGEMIQCDGHILNNWVALKPPTRLWSGMVAVEDFLNKKNVALIEAFYPGMEGLENNKNTKNLTSTNS